MSPSPSPSLVAEESVRMAARVVDSLARQVTWRVCQSHLGHLCFVCLFFLHFSSLLFFSLAKRLDPCAAHFQSCMQILICSHFRCSICWIQYVYGNYCSRLSPIHRMNLVFNFTFPFSHSFSFLHFTKFAFVQQNVHQLCGYYAFIWILSKFREKK